jgi:hypothetical protein
VRLLSVLCWWNEQPSWLADVVHGLTLAGVNQLVAVDGAYENFPGGTAASPIEQAQAIMAAAHDAGIMCDVYEPRELWANEPAKRTRSFRIMDDYRPDWFLVIDADEVITDAPADLKERLEDTDRDQADACLLDAPSAVLASGFLDDEEALPNTMLSRVVMPRRCLFRWSPGITVGPRHFDYIRPDGVNLWGDMYGQPLVIPDLVIDHRNPHREPGRRELARAYWQHVRTRVGDEPPTAGEVLARDGG